MPPRPRQFDKVATTAELAKFAIVAKANKVDKNASRDKVSEIAQLSKDADTAAATSAKEVCHG